MLKPFTSHLLKTSLVLVFLSSASSFAGKEDFTKTIKVASNYQEGDGINKQAIYRGNVQISQGTLMVKADEVQVDASLGEGKEVFIASGNPAEYSQQQEDGSTVKAKANQIMYKRATRSLSLDGDALIEQNSSSVKGNSILFNMELEQIIAQGNNQESGRVITIFQPESTSESNAAKQQESQP
ncbi:lipopolysaccharide transport periplasmic protein LptA [Paraglaciecola aquimarina]|uniref:Lipopolysaccharide export system protein LptA n=1 Tax=Paraglaciecola aquimarina TaxID=1235557 RepID=A0ABU3SS67_9ALTE|nr:lipopolysaccharide transport periplasmic protein LptA [Paraglaciecola aquimarina]MDU0352830.1 lipopolysaccharide transport periplasmic protein LptA [Paraglaciecola aquimarina]